jgi:hypothetical protein
MNVNNEECSSERYAVISYSHDDVVAVKEEMERFDGRSICYWYDKDMVGGKSYEDEFRGKLDYRNCGGCIFFISESFLLSSNCAAEVEYFIEKYSVKNSDKFCFFVLPEHLAHIAGDTTVDKLKKFSEVVEDYAKTHPVSGLSGEGQSKLIKKHVELFLKASSDGKSLFGVLGNRNGYVENYVKKGQTFYNAAIIYGHQRISEIRFGFFPQGENMEVEHDENEGSGHIGMNEKRYLDKKPAYYAPVDWLVVSDTILLSKKLLFVVDYLNLKYPINPPGETVTAYIKREFLKYFDKHKVQNPEYTVKSVRFLEENELAKLLLSANNDPDSAKRLQRKREILLPEPTYFAQLTNRKNSQAFWLAGDMKDARRVDSGTERLSENPAGVELYYVRIALEVEKNAG